MRNFIEQHDKQLLRLLEILPGFVSWNLILFPYWGIFIIPDTVAYFILIFNIYWFYQSIQIAFTVVFSHLKIQAAMKYDWLKDLKNLPDSKKIKHIVIIPTYKEPLKILERTFESLIYQTLPTKQIIPVLALEEREPEEDRKFKVNFLKEKYKDTFYEFIITVHKLSEGEVIGKSSNEKFAAIAAKEKLVDNEKIDINDLTITSADADHKFHPNHYAALTYGFLKSKKRYHMFWQPAVLFYNNIWELPAITRVPNTLMSIWNLSQLPRKDRLINGQNYSLSLKLLDEVGYWDADKIPEDWGIFFKSYYKSGGLVEVEPIYLPVYADAAFSTSFFATLKNQYLQIQRWAWGVSDDPWIIKNYFLTKNINFFDKTLRLINVIWAHFFWPVNWFIITLGLSLPVFLNPAFGRTTLGYNVPKLSSFLLTIALVFLVIMIIVDSFYKPKRPATFPLWRMIIAPFEFVLMPVAGFFFSALPGLDAHTRLMLGKYIEYRVTEKV
ncbi:glycosyltransferase family 2 protein [Candidatus Woesebacteria bacterium]|nr:glycosyltransferase family 2 protein [Candidatus Woesebacteria bacterium]